MLVQTRNIETLKTTITVYWITGPIFLLTKLSVFYGLLIHLTVAQNGLLILAEWSNASQTWFKYFWVMPLSSANLSGVRRIFNKLQYSGSLRKNF